MNRSLFFPFLLLHLFWSCDADNKDFASLKKGVRYKRVVLGEGNGEVDIGEGVLFAFGTSSLREKELIGRDTLSCSLEKEGFWSPLISTMAVGDSSVFLIDRELLDPLPLGLSEKGIKSGPGALKLEVRLLARSKRFPLLGKALEEEGDKLVSGARWEEWRRIRDTVEQLFEDPASHYVEGIYLSFERRGEGMEVKSGREISMHYRGYLPGGKVFDNSYSRGEPLSFRFGDPGQVIEGLEIGLKHMKEGDRAKLVIPKGLSFEKKRWGKGIPTAPPFVYYEIELVDVDDPRNRLSLMN